jgi:hypothetical protein
MTRLSTLRLLHVMRDHPSHSQYATNSGIRGAIPNMHSLLLMQRQRNRHTENMTFLNTVVWMKAKSFVYHHDSFSCGNPFSEATRKHHDMLLTIELWYIVGISSTFTSAPSS